jgi:hypothetical protein
VSNLTRAHDQVRQSCLCLAFRSFQCLRVAVHRCFERCMLDGSLRFYLGQQLLLTQQRPLQELIEPKPAVLSSALKRKSKPPRIYNLGGRPALSAAT